jgi:hypothetical protein
LYDLLSPHVNEVLVCDPRRDARQLAELLYMDKLKAVYQGEHGVRTLKELSRSYLAISGELPREASVHRRVKIYYEQMDTLRLYRQQGCHELLA